jgi:hypothetical protein
MKRFLAALGVALIAAPTVHAGNDSNDHTCAFDGMR